MAEQNFNRNSAGHIDFPEGTGGITGMSGLGGKYACLEIYKTDAFMRVKMAEQIDPEAINPPLKHSRQVYTDYGSANPVLARFFLQADSFMKIARLTQEEKEETMAAIREASDELIAAQKIKQSLEADSTSAKQSSVEETNTIVVPSINNLDQRVREFIGHSKMFLNKLLAVFNMLFGQNFPDAFFHKAREYAEQEFGKDDVLAQHLEEYANLILLVINLRNAAEHRDSLLTLKIDNFRLDTMGKLLEPMMSLKGEDKKNKANYDIDLSVKTSLEQLFESLLSFGELLVVCMLPKKFPDHFPWQILQIPADKINPEVPLNYQVGINFNTEEGKGS